MLGWPERLPAGTKFSVGGVVYKFVDRARFTTVGGDGGRVGKPSYVGACVPVSMAGGRVVKTVPAGDVRL